MFYYITLAISFIHTFYHDVVVILLVAIKCVTYTVLARYLYKAWTVKVHRCRHTTSGSLNTCFEYCLNTKYKMTQCYTLLFSHRLPDLGPVFHRYPGPLTFPSLQQSHHRWGRSTVICWSSLSDQQERFETEGQWLGWVSSLQGKGSTKVMCQSSFLDVSWACRLWLEFQSDCFQSLLTFTAV